MFCNDTNDEELIIMILAVIMVLIVNDNLILNGDSNNGNDIFLYFEPFS